MQQIEAVLENGYRERYSVNAAGENEGLYESFYPNGSIHSRCYFENGNMEGPFEIYFPNQKLCTKYTYRNGAFNGAYEQYYDSGQLAVSCSYKDGEMDGVCKIYKVNGRLDEKRIYRMGKRLSGKEADEYLAKLRLEAIAKKRQKDGGR